MTESGWGSLSVREEGSGRRTFLIDTVGANSHSCTIGGDIEGARGIASDGSPSGRCVVTFTVNGTTVEVASEPLGDDFACRRFCGARAGFDGTYRLPSPACRPESRQKRRESFLGEYRAKRYAAAFKTLDSVYAECGEFFNWIDRDSVKNDLAVTLYHLGEPEKCLVTLASTIGASNPDGDSLREKLPPADFDNYLPIAEATWHNLKLCRGCRAGLDSP